MNQILGWVALGERSHPFRLVHEPAFYIDIDESLCFIVPILIPSHAPKFALENPLVLPCFLGLFRDTFHQRRRAVFPFLFGVVDCMD